MTVDIDYVYSRLVCEFNHYDICIDGIIEVDGVKKFCKLYDDHLETDRIAEYEIYDVDWTSECLEYLDDYMKTFNHWCYKNCKRQRGLDEYTKNIKWFNEKWDKNPIRKQIKDRTCHQL